MTELWLIILAALTVMFVLLLVIRSLSHWRFCVLCASVSLVWLAMLAMYWMGLIENATAIALLLGASVTGIYYLVERKTPERLHVFRLPFFLTVLLAGALLVGNVENIFPPFILLVVIWLVFGLLYAFRQRPKWRSVIKKIVECCKNW